MLEFLKEYWPMLVCAVLIVASIILLIIFRDREDAAQEPANNANDANNAYANDVTPVTEQPVYEETPAYTEAPVYEETPAYTEEPASFDWNDSFVAEETPVYTEEPAYEQPVQERRVVGYDEETGAPIYEGDAQPAEENTFSDFTYEEPVEEEPVAPAPAKKQPAKKQAVKEAVEEEPAEEASEETDASALVAVEDDADFEEKKERKGVYMVTYDKASKEWIVRKTGAQRASKRCRTKKQAVKVAEHLATTQDLNITVKKKNGKFQKKGNAGL